MALHHGSSLLIATQSGAGAVDRVVQDKLRDVVSIFDFLPASAADAVRAGTSTDDLSAYFTTASATARVVHLPAGTYKLNTTNLSSNTIFEGEGETTVLRPYAASNIIACNSGSDSSHITGLQFRDIKFYGLVEVNGFSEFVHLLRLDGVKRCKIQNCIFDGFQGDGVYLGGGANSGAIRHNVDVIIDSCHFDGINNDNRNGLSVIDVDGLVVRGCTFRNCAKSTMPGSLDVEPNYTTQAAKNIRIEDNYFENTLGNRGHVCIQTQNTALVGNITIKGNQFYDTNATSAVSISAKLAALSTPWPISIHSNQATIAGGNFIYARDGDLNGVSICDNISYSLRGVWFSKTTTSPTHSNTVIHGNIFFLEGGGYGVILSENVANVSIKNNIINGAPHTHVQVGGNGSAAGVSVVGNDFVGTPTSRVLNDASITHSPATNLLLNNRFEVGHTHLFRAYRCDYAGGQPGVYAVTVAPGDFPPGVSVSYWSSVSGPTGTDTGTAVTTVPSADITTVEQRFTPQYTAGNLTLGYYRRAVNASTWSAWKTVTAT